MNKIRFLIFSVLCLTFFQTYAQLSFKGGDAALSTFLTNTIIYPEYARQNCIAATIQVNFKVDKAGNVNSVTVQRGLGIDLDAEAVRVVKLTSGKWIVPTGYNTNSTIVLPIKFTPDYSHCTGVTTATINAAIAGYKAQEGLQDAVTNYYKNKYAGKADPAKEPQILALKKQLGYTDEFINELLDQANQKLKQGDKEGACTDWNFIRNIGSNKADQYINKYCK